MADAVMPCSVPIVKVSFSQLSRILCVADTYDAIISDRPYRAGLTKARAREILEEAAGTQLDPKVVKAFLTIEPRLRLEEAEKLLLYTI